MEGTKGQAVMFILLTAGLILAVCLGSRDSKTVLEFGMFAGSNWDVANADSLLRIVLR